MYILLLYPYFLVFLNHIQKLMIPLIISDFFLVEYDMF